MARFTAERYQSVRGHIERDGADHTQYSLAVEATSALCMADNIIIIVVVIISIYTHKEVKIYFARFVRPSCFQGIAKALELTESREMQTILTAAMTRLCCARL